MSIKPTPPTSSGVASSDASAPQSTPDTAGTTTTPAKEGATTTDGTPAAETDSFIEVAAQATALQAASVDNFLLNALQPSSMSNNILTMASWLNELNQGATLGANLSALLQPLPGPILNTMLVESALSQLTLLTQFFGLELNADALLLMATLDGNPATLLDSATDANTLWRALALSNLPLQIAAFAATGKEVDPDSGLLPDQAYRVRGTFLDANQQQQVRLERAVEDTTAAQEEGRVQTLLTVPFSALQRATLLALLGDPRIDIPYKNVLNETQGPIRASCCLLAHATGAATPLSQVARNPTRLDDPRCASCPVARQLCLPT